jgi:hypothetical protein
VEYAAVLPNRFEVGADGKTNYERNKGKRCSTLGIEFGEAVMWRRKHIGGALGKLTSLWEDGIYLGVVGKSGEFMVGDGRGIWKTRSIQRKPLGERWDAYTINLVKHPPWRTSDDDPDADEPIPEVVKLIAAEEETERGNKDATIPRRVYISKEDLDKFGYSAQCIGCRSILRGTRRQGHSEACRKRLEKELQGADKIERTKRKLDEFMGDVLAKEDEKRLQEEETRRGRRTLSTPANDSQNTGSASSSDLTDGARKRQLEEAKGDDTISRRRIEEDAGERRVREEQKEPEDRPLKKMMVGNFEVNQDEDFEDEMIGDFGEGEYFDDRTGDVLDSSLVMRAEAEELEYMVHLGVGDEVDEQECWDKTGKAPTTTKFVRTNKGTTVEPDVRARLCGRDFKPKGEDGRCDVFAAMPPLEAKKMLFRMAAMDKRVWGDRRWQKRKIMLIDVKKAHLNGVVSDDVYAYVRLPDDRIWRLWRWLYGMRPAAQAWEEDYARKLETLGFVWGKSAPTVFFRPTTRCRCVVHGDDFTFSGYGDELKEVADKMREWYDLKVRGVLGGEDGDDTRVTILNRVLTWEGDYIDHRADDKHVQVIKNKFGLNAESKGLEAPAEKEDLGEGFGEAVDDEELENGEAKRFRGVAARIN